MNTTLETTLYNHWVSQYQGMYEFLRVLYLEAIEQKNYNLSDRIKTKLAELEIPSWTL